MQYIPPWTVNSRGGTVASTPPLGVSLQGQTFVILRIWNFAAEPNDKLAIVGVLPKNVRPSVCHAILSDPSKYNLRSIALYDALLVAADTFWIILSKQEGIGW